jgi:hypothetical protein
MLGHWLRSLALHRLSHHVADTRRIGLLAFATRFFLPFCYWSQQASQCNGTWPLPRHWWSARLYGEVGTLGYEEFLQAIRDSQHPQHQAKLQRCGGAFDPGEFDPMQAQDRLDGLSI